MASKSYDAYAVQVNAWRLIIAWQGLINQQKCRYTPLWGHARQTLAEVFHIHAQVGAPTSAETQDTLAGRGSLAGRNVDTHAAELHVLESFAEVFHVHARSWCPDLLKHLRHHLL